jgi:putative polyketide hydroxylase
VADRFKEGRVLLVGDSAHVMPPTGGFGGNTGIQDAYNLAWKLEAVVNGAARPELLETYDAERRPIADRTVAQSLARLQAWFKDPGKKLPPAEPIVDDYAVVFGYRFQSGAFIGDAPDASGQVFDNPRAPSGRPGSRASHVVVERNGKRASTIDLFGDYWVLLAGPRGHDWCEAADKSAAARRMDLQCYRMGPHSDLHDVYGRWSAAYGVADDGAVLIRPDGFIAWRSHQLAADPETVMRTVLERLSFRNGKESEERFKC